MRGKKTMKRNCCCKYCKQLQWNNVSAVNTHKYVPSEREKVNDCWTQYKQNAEKARQIVKVTKLKRQVTKRRKYQPQESLFCLNRYLWANSIGNSFIQTFNVWISFSNSFWAKFPKQLIQKTLEIAQNWIFSSNCQVWTMLHDSRTTKWHLASGHPWKPHRKRWIKAYGVSTCDRLFLFFEVLEDIKLYIFASRVSCQTK